MDQIKDLPDDKPEKIFDFAPYGTQGGWLGQHRLGASN
jgi:hypothetical protein